MTAEYADKIRRAVVRLLDEDAAAAARIRKGSDRILAVADETHKHPLPTRSQVEDWPAAHIDETKRYMFDAVKAWRTAAVALEPAVGTNTLPAGSIRMRDGTTYMMVAGTDRLNPTGGSWLTKATNDPSQGWTPIDGSWREWTPNATPGKG